MNNSLSKEEIKLSVDYIWRKHLFKTHLIIWGAIELCILFLSTVRGLFDREVLEIGLSIFAMFSTVYSLIFIPIIIYYGYKMNYLVKNYSKFYMYEVVLNEVSTSYFYRGAVYYCVKFEHNGKSIYVHTSPCFSSHFLSKIKLEEYNNKKVMVLYDSDLDKVYVIKKI